MSAISIYRATTVELQSTISGLDSLGGYTGHFVVKKRYGYSEKLIENDSSDVDGMVITFSLDSTDTDISKGNYVYEFSISDATNRYIVTQGILTIKDVLKW